MSPAATTRSAAVAVGVSAVTASAAALTPDVNALFATNVVPDPAWPRLRTSTVRESVFAPVIAAAAMIPAPVTLPSYGAAT
jgi:hypothetical protein